MSTSEKEVLSLLESQKHDFDLKLELQKDNFELLLESQKDNFEILLESQKRDLERQRAIDNKNSQKEINELKSLFKIEINETDEDKQDDAFLNESPITQVEDNLFNKLKSIFLRILGLRSYSTLSNLNTKTISMYAVAKVVNSSSTKAWKTFVALVCFAVVQLQVVVLTYVVNEATRKTCYSISDCPFGTYCGMLYQDFSTCVDCADFYNKTQYYETMCPSQLGDKNWNEMDSIEDFDHNELWVNPRTNYNHTMCYGFKHCSNTDLDTNTNFKGHCDYIRMNRNKMEGRTWLTLFFLSLLWSLPIYQDIEESALEEVVLDHHNSGSFSFPVEVVRIALRIRRFFLPFITTLATVCLIVTDDISGKNIILNLLAVTFITESDNILALLFLRKSQKELMEKAVEPIDIEMIPDLNIVICWCRLQGLGCVFNLLITLHLIQTFMNRCDGIGVVGTMITYFLFSFGNTAECMYRLFFMKKYNETFFLRIINALIEYFRNYIAAFIAFELHEGIRILNKKAKEIDENRDKAIDISIISPAVVIFIGFIGLSIFKKKHYRANSHT